MKSWDYSDGIPNVPVAIIGRDTTIREWGFGSKKAKKVKLGKIMIRFIKDTEVVVAVPSEDDYPEKAPRLILGRNFMEKFRIVLDGISQRISVDDVVKQGEREH